MRTLSILAVIFYVACQQPGARTLKHTFDLGPFKIDVPKTWKKVMSYGIDSETGLIVVDRSDTLYFSFGWFSNNLSEDLPFIIYRGNVSKNMDTSEMVIMERKHWDPDRFKKNNVFWDTISGLEAKIVVPIKDGHGKTGVYFDSCSSSRNGKMNFNLHGTDLDPANQEDLLSAIKTLKLH